MNDFELWNTPCDAPLKLREMERQRQHEEFMAWLKSDEFKRIAEQVAANMAASTGDSNG